MNWRAFAFGLREYEAALRWSRKYRVRTLPGGERQMTIYVLDSAPGDTIEEKIYGTISDGFEESGHDPVDPEGGSASFGFGTFVREAYRIVAVREHHYGVNGCILEYEVTIQGEKDDINEYEEALKELE